MSRPVPHREDAAPLLAPGQFRHLLPSWARTFPGAPQQAAAARHFVLDLLNGSPLRDDAALVVCELFTNAVMHTDSGRPGGLATVQVCRWRLGVRIAVTDQGPRSNQPVIVDSAAYGEPAEHGNGLFLVSQLARRLYWHDDLSGRTICAVLGDLPPRLGASQRGIYLPDSAKLPQPV